MVAGFGSIWVSTGPGDTLVRIDPDTGKAIDLITFPYSASVLAVGPDSIWISSFDGNKVSRIDPATDKVTGTVDPGTADRS